MRDRQEIDERDLFFFFFGGGEAVRLLNLTKVVVGAS